MILSTFPPGDLSLPVLSYPKAVQGHGQGLNFLCFKYSRL